MGERLDGVAVVVRPRHPCRERSREGRERLRLGDLGLPVADPDLHRREREVRAHAPPELGVLGDRARVVEEAHEALVLRPRGECVRHAAAREEAREDLRARGVQSRVHALGERGARRERQELGEEVSHRRDDRDGAISTLDRDMDVEPERVVAPDDVPEELVVSPVVRRVDDALFLPVRPGVGPGRAEHEPHRLDQRLQLRPTLGDRGRNVRERLLLARSDLDFRGDELADEVLLERGAARGCVDVLEAVREVEGLRIEDRELLLDGDGEVGCGLELCARLRYQLVRREALLVSHGRTTVVGASLPLHALSFCFGSGPSPGR